MIYKVLIFIIFIQIFVINPEKHLQALRDQNGESSTIH
jgi:hypothetical protein